MSQQHEVKWQNGVLRMKIRLMVIMPASPSPFLSDNFCLVYKIYYRRKKIIAASLEKGKMGNTSRLKQLWSTLSFLKKLFFLLACSSLLYHNQSETSWGRVKYKCLIGKKCITCFGMRIPQRLRELGCVFKLLCSSSPTQVNRL